MKDTGVLLSGALSVMGSLQGRVSVVKEHERYDGSCHITPKASESQILHTSDRLLASDIIIDEIPCQETPNQAGGTTVYIAKED